MPTMSPIQPRSVTLPHDHPDSTPRSVTFATMLWNRGHRGNPLSPFTHRRRFYYDLSVAENVADRDKSQEKRSRSLHDRRALRSRHAYFEHVQYKRNGISRKKSVAARKYRGEIFTIRRSMILNVAAVNANGRNEDHNFPNCSIKTPIGLDPFFSDRGLIGMIVVKSQLCVNGGDDDSLCSSVCLYVHVDPLLICKERGLQYPWSVRPQTDERSLCRLGKNQGFSLIARICSAPTMSIEGSQETIDVYCDMTTDGGGWTVN
ncbi:hypothetical protein DPMN_046689 [Dreissena polymorpha]|uniref:Fibrinogen C-terminal domain-containing protein n=1 Tax=Dreissena polymorpha TaxID=45954 RepID=A0A9D4D7A9_DREPO|nr:hypothetical protein DPMN_046689 [Dreissena polymorpha]